MADLTTNDVLVLARVAGVTIPAGDLAEVTLRLSVTLSALERIPDEGLDALDPSPVLPDAGDGG